MKIKIATKQDLPIIFPTLHRLRPQLTLEQFQTQFEVQRTETYQIIFLGENTSVYALAGFRTMHCFFTGKTLYIDDLVTHAQHSKRGYAGQLLDWLKKYASENKYNHIALDSGFTRKDAHRLYLKHGFEIECMHFGLPIS